MESSTSDLVGAITQLNAKKPLSTTSMYDLLVYQDGLLFVAEGLGEVLRVVGTMVTGSTGGLAGGAVAMHAANTVMAENLNRLNQIERSALITNPKNVWCLKETIRSVVIHKGWFLHNLIITLADGRILRCASKRGYGQIDTIVETFLKAMPDVTKVT